MALEANTFHYKCFADLDPFNFPNPEAPRLHKEWHTELSEFDRKLSVSMLVQHSLPSDDKSAYFNDEMQNLIHYCRNIEKEFVERANYKREYNYLVCGKLLHLDRMKREREENVLERNKKCIEGIQDEESQLRVLQAYRCKLCLNGLQLFSCPECWNAICKGCHEKMKNSNIAKKCQYCRKENPRYELLLLPRF